MNATLILIWIERALLATAVALAMWCAIVLIEARRTRAIPIPPPQTSGVVATQPDHTLADPARPRPVVEAGAWVARLEAPTVHLSATVLEGTADATLGRGAGHIEDTPFPGEPGNIGIAGHRDTIFRPVRNLRIGDPLVLTDADHVYKYRIANTSIVNRQTCTCSIRPTIRR